MSQYSPPFSVSTKAVNLIAGISALVERFAIRMEQADALKLRRANRIRTIHSSLAIEGNTLSVDQVSDILDGKLVVAPAREIQEVKNAIATYDLYPDLDPFAVDDLLKAHQTMMAALVERPGHFRRSGVGVFAGQTVIHVAPPHNRVPALIADLFAWLKQADDHPLVKSCVFHYEFEFIHPFMDGNGRMGRLWQSLILGAWNPVFQHLPVENRVYTNQQAYYEAIQRSTGATNCAPFIDFMLGEILHTLEKHRGEAREAADSIGTNIGLNIGANIGLNQTQHRILALLKANPAMTAARLAAEIGIARRNVEANIAALKKNGLLRRTGASRNGRWEVSEACGILTPENKE
jgi:Fic family protein